MSDDEVTMQRFDGKITHARADPYVTIMTSDTGQPTLRFNAKAKEQFLYGVQYVDYYLADDGSMVGVKPVEGGEVSDTSYSLSYNSVAFGSIASEMDLALNGTVRLDVTWDDENGMVVFDVSDLDGGQP